MLLIDHGNIAFPTKTCLRLIKMRERQGAIEILINHDNNSHGYLPYLSLHILYSSALRSHSQAPGFIAEKSHQLHAERLFSQFANVLRAWGLSRPPTHFYWPVRRINKTNRSG